MEEAYKRPSLEWIGLDDEEIHQAFCHVEYETNINWQDDPEAWCKAFARHLEKTFKDKN